MKRYFQYFACISLSLAFLTTFLTGQDIRDQDEIIRVETNMVFVDVLVRDKRSRRVVTDLTRENFKLFVDGRSREITSFGLDGTARVPLTIFLFFNLAPEGALRFLTESRFQKSLRDSLDGLGPQDEVSVVATRDWFVGKPEVVVTPTRNWEKVAASIGEVVANSPVGKVKPTSTAEKRSMSAAIDQVKKLRSANQGRQTVMIYISDGVNTLETMEFDKRKALADRLSMENIGFGAINFDLKTSYAVASKVIDPLAYLFGASVTGSVNYFAEETGGVSINVEKAADFGNALTEMIAVYSSRYGIGFEVDDKDNDGRKHRLVIKIDERTAEQKSRKLIVNARRSFYVTNRPR
ncbi:MAG: VWA domain-containing protein [Pyrinomonadaceae bacterium]